MENKEELEVFNGNGADEIDKRATEQVDPNKDILNLDLSNINVDFNKDGIVTEEEKDKARELILNFAKESEEAVKQSYLEAYDTLGKEDKDNISEKDIDDLVKFGKINNDSVKVLEEERQKILEEKDKELFDKFNKAIGGELSKNQKIWNEIKRGFTVGLVFGVPGILFITIKDCIDNEIMKKQLREATKELIDSKDPNKLQACENIMQRKMGAIIDVKGVIGNIKASGYVNSITRNKEELEKVSTSIATYGKSVDKKMENYLDKVDEEEKEELQKQREQEEKEEEENPEPVEGMKMF